MQKSIVFIHSIMLFSSLMYKWMPNYLFFIQVWQFFRENAKIMIEIHFRFVYNGTITVQKTTCI